MQRVCNLPNNANELRSLGFSDEAIDTLKDTIMLIDPDASRIAKRMQEILHYMDDLDKMKASDPLNVKCEVSDSELVSKFPSDKIRLGSQLVVYPG